MKTSSTKIGLARPRNRDAHWQFLYLLPALAFFIAFTSTLKELQDECNMLLDNH